MKMRDRIIILTVCACLMGVGMTACKASDSGTEAKPKETSEAIEKPNETQDPAQDPKENETRDYQAILDDYSQRLRDATPGLIDEYNAEASGNTEGITGLATIANNKVMDLAEIEAAGTTEMATYLYTGGSGEYSEYEEWAMQLYAVYEEEAQKIYDVYTQSAL